MSELGMCYIVRANVEISLEMELFRLGYVNVGW